VIYTRSALFRNLNIIGWGIWWGKKNRNAMDKFDFERSGLFT